MRTLPTAATSEEGSEPALPPEEEKQKLEADRQGALKAAIDKFDLKAIIEALGLPLGLFVAIEAFILVGEVALVVWGVKLLPPEWLSGLPEEVRSFLQIGS